MSRPMHDGPDLEDRLRAALHAEADGLVFETPERFEPGLSPAPSSEPGRWPWGPRLTLVVTGVGAAAAVVLFALLMRDDAYDTTTVEDSSDGGAQESPSPEVANPSGSRWFILDLPGVTPTGVDWYTEPGPTELGPDEDERTFQAFRSDAGFDGPAVWVEGSPASDDSGFGEDSPDATEITIQGSRAYLSEYPDGGVRLGWPGGDDGGFYMTAAHMSADDVVVFAEGLRPRPDREGGGWEATVLPQGLAELDLNEIPLDEYEYAEWSYQGPDQANYELFVYEGGPVVFESWAREHVSSNGNVEEISVGGRPGMLIEDESESVVVWRPTDDSVVDFRTNHDPVVAALDALRPVSEQEWLDHFPPEIRP